ncbi:hypothetical protein [Bythopirellula polymerisocia]|uniref:hypothetical protein n=1 Tax=Bythopirellula polymerisocia TaxID=2528003 RepID=UPI0018D363A6|nr:hypothetical protein [Bythopirellula polymerisocia]
MRSLTKKASEKIESSIQARCQQVRENWSDSEKTLRRMWAQMAQRQLMAASVTHETVH